ncbi:MAG: class I SAM-dependent methyltransferase [Candidatus Gracilibacteria bacterium]|jgi:O-antigen chain-terminating methyltransferase|nr:class I SAM-dependent methyltransferase [Candidatus Gracilibacteria bacterium]
MENNNENFSVVEIMKELKQKALKRKMSVDNDFLKSLDLRKLKPVSAFEIEKSGIDGQISKKLVVKKIQKKGLYGRIVNYGLRKFYFALRYLLDGLILSQEKFNERVLRFMSKRSKEIDFDYSSFEEKFRGSTEKVLEKQRKYLPFFEGRENVLDIGFGRGEFLDFLSQSGVKAIGVDSYFPFVTDAKRRGFSVYNADALDFVQSFDGKFNGVFCSQFAEHTESAYLYSLIKSVFEKLETGAFFVMETINVKSLSVFSNSVYMDPTHFRPIHPETLKFFFESAGFRDVSFIFSGDFSPEEKLRELIERDENDKIYNENIRKMNELLFAPQDYAVVGKK